jgi:hypothetical protein
MNREWAQLGSLCLLVGGGAETDEFVEWLAREIETPAEEPVRKAISDERVTQGDWERLRTPNVAPVMPRKPSCKAAPIQCRDRNDLRMARWSRSLNVNRFFGKSCRPTYVDWNMRTGSPPLGRAAENIDLGANENEA